MSDLFHHQQFDYDQKEFSKVKLLAKFKEIRDFRPTLLQRLYHELPDEIGIFNMVQGYDIDKTTILLIGNSGSGKSSCINRFFGITKPPYLCPISDTKSETMNVSEYGVLIPIDDYLYRLNVIDTPGLFDTKKHNLGDLDIVHFEGILSHLKYTNRIGRKSVNVILLVFKCENRIEGEKSQFSQALVKIKAYFSQYMNFGNCNIFCVMTHARVLDAKGNYIEAKNILQESIRKELCRVFGEFDGYKIPIVFLENEQAKTTVREIIKEDNKKERNSNDWIDLPDGSECPKNLFEEIQSRLETDFVSRWIIAHYFSKRLKEKATTPKLLVRTSFNDNDVPKIIELSSRRNPSLCDKEANSLYLEFRNSIQLSKYAEKLAEAGLTDLDTVQGMSAEEFFNEIDPNNEMKGYVKTRLIKNYGLKTTEQLKLEQLECAPFLFDIQKGFDVCEVDFKSEVFNFESVDYLNTFAADEREYGLPKTIRFSKDHLKQWENICSVDKSENSILFCGKAGISFDFSQFKTNFLFKLLNGSQITSYMNYFSIIYEKQVYLARIVSPEKCFKKSFQNSVCNLPSKYEENKESYKKFIKTFGTHYIREAGFGGTVTWTSTFKEENEEFIKKRLFTAQTVLSKFFDAESSLDSEKFKLKTYMDGSFQFSINGGCNIPTMETKDDIKIWEESLYKNPKVIKSSLKLISISQLVELIDKSKLVEMDKALKEYYEQNKDKESERLHYESKTKIKNKEFKGTRDEVASEAAELTSKDSKNFKKRSCTIL